MKIGGGGEAGPARGGDGPGLGAMSAESMLAPRFDRGVAICDGGGERPAGGGGSPLYGACVQQRILITD